MEEDKKIIFYEWLDNEFKFEQLFGCEDYFNAIDEIMEKSKFNYDENVRLLICSVVSLTKDAVIKAMAKRLNVESLAIKKELLFDKFEDITPISLNSFKNRVEKNDLKTKIQKLTRKIAQLEQKNGK